MGIGAISSLPKQLVNTAQHRAIAQCSAVLVTADGAFAVTKYFL